MAVEVVAVGRVNVDIVMTVDKLPRGPNHIMARNAYVSVGGSAANFAMQSARLRVKTGLISCVGNDPHGNTAVRELSKGGVDTKQILVLERQMTGVFVVIRDSTGNTMICSEQGANRFLDRHALDEEYLARASAVHVAGGFPRIIARAADIATTNGLVLSLDPGRAAESVEFSTVLPKTDVLFLNRKELKMYFGIEPSRAALLGFARKLPGIVVVKQGRRGAVATDGLDYYTSEVFEVPVADTLGAGDAFAAGFLMAWNRTDDIEHSLNVANAVAALTITCEGAQRGQPTLEQTLDLLREHGVPVGPLLRSYRSRKRQGVTSR